MSDDERIQVGDIVYCQINENVWLNGIVLHIPCATGDCWQIESGLSGYRSLNYIQTFQYIQKALKVSA